MRDSTTVATDLSFMLGHLYTIGIVASLEQIAFMGFGFLCLCVAYGIHEAFSN